MKLVIVILAAAVALTGCSQASSGSGQSARGQEEAAASSPAMNDATELGDKVRGEVAKAGRQGADTKLAASYQQRGDEALRDGKLIYAAEQYGRAEEALAASGIKAILESDEEDEEARPAKAVHHRSSIAARKSAAARNKKPAAAPKN